MPETATTSLEGYNGRHRVLQTQGKFAQVWSELARRLYNISRVLPVSWNIRFVEVHLDQSLFFVVLYPGSVSLSLLSKNRS
jgi:hypothetical protein